jgi:hypothetical protein
VRVTAAYAVMLVVVATTLDVLGPRAQNRVISHMSTNLQNLGHGHLGTLFGSAFVTGGGQIYTWLPGLVCLLAVSELLWRSRHVVLAFALGHIGATLIVTVGLAAAIHLGWVASSVARANDVGISYGAAAVLGALTAAIPPRWRPVWVGWWLAVGVWVAACTADFTAAGHCVALTLGMLLSTRFHSVPCHWTAMRLVLLAGGVAFSYLTLANSGSSLLAGAVGGLAGVLVARTTRGAARRSHPAPVLPEQPVDPVAQFSSSVSRC